MAELTKDTPILQPGSYDPATKELAYESRSIWWWNNGIWGDSGYAVPNDGNKPRSGNEAILRVVSFLGAELFSLMHKPDVQFSRPFNADWLYDLNKMLTLGIKRMGDLSIGWTDKRTGDAKHATNTPQAFTVYPVPFFGGRIRQADAKTWCGEVLLLLSELMQHSDNGYDNDITDAFCSQVQMTLRRIQGDMAMKYLGASRVEVEAETFAVPATAFDKGSYIPEALFTSRELVEERMPDLWWPTTNDLTPIYGVPAPIARIHCAPWPDQGDFGDGGAVEAAFPGGGVNLVSTPGAR